MHEASCHDENSWITLTYNNEHLPEGKTVKKTHYQKFMKKLRKEIEPQKIRHFGCGEYGEKYSRPHYHLCIFGYMFPDLELIRSGKIKRFKNRFKTGNDNNLYHSEMLSTIWGKGFVTVGEVTFESAGYTARYMTKKVKGKMSGEHYQSRNPEFALMSRRPGIAAEWIKQYMSDVYPKDFHTTRGIKMRPNRFYDDRFKKINPVGYEKLKERRKKFQERYGENPAVNGMRGYQKEKHRKNVTKSLERKMEDA